MSEVSTENRLRLLKQIRSRYEEDQNDLSSRERILYGHSSRPDTVRYSYDGNSREAELSEEQPSFFRLRLAVALLLAAAVIFMDRKQVSLAGITSDQVYGAISADYEEKLEEWASDRDLQPPT